MNRGDVVLIDFPYTDQTGSKVRPALVVLADRYNHKLSQTILALISSSRNRFVGDPSQFVIDPSTPESQLTGLRIPSVVICETLMTVQQRRVIATLGRFSSSFMARVDDCLRSSLDL